MLEIQDIHVSYGNVEVVRGVSASVSPGRVTLILGANGAGKTTSLRAVAGLMALTSGHVALDGRLVDKVNAHSRVRLGIVLVPEGRRVFAPLSVLENLRLGAYTASRSNYGENLSRVFDMFPILLERRSKPAGLLSGGEQQMLAFGRGLMSEPKYLLIDEPSMGLSPALVEIVLDCVRAIADSQIGVLMVEQNADAGLDVADDVVVMARGEVAFSGVASAAKASSSLVRAFLGEVPLDGP